MLHLGRNTTVHNFQGHRRGAFAEYLSRSRHLA
jgi:hypothetical protein